MGVYKLRVSIEKSNIIDALMINHIILNLWKLSRINNILC